MRRTHLLAALLTLTCLHLLAPPAEARTRSRQSRRAFDRGFELSTYFTHNDFEPEVEIDDDFGVGFRFGYLFTPHHQLDFMLNDVTTEDTVFPGIGVDVTNVQVAYVFNFTRSDVVPYVTAGIGIVQTDDDALGSESDSVLSAGGGVRLFVGPVFHIRFEARFNRFEGDGRVFLAGDEVSFREFSFGVGWRFPAW